MFVSKTSSRHLQDMSSRRLQCNNSLSSKTSWRRLQDVLKTYLQDVLEDEKLLRWRRAEDVFKTCLEDVFKTSWRPTNVCWVLSENLWNKSFKLLSGNHCKNIHVQNIIWEINPNNSYELLQEKSMQKIRKSYHRRIIENICYKLLLEKSLQTILKTF